MVDTIKNSTVLRDLAEIAAVAPKDSTTTSTRIDLSGTSAATSGNVAAGYYEVALDKTGGVALLCWGDTAVIPAAGATSTAGTFPVHDGEVIKAPGGTKASGILTGSNTGIAFLTPLVS